jgi:hypothetical protein
LYTANPTPPSTNSHKKGCLLDFEVDADCLPGDKGSFGFGTYGTVGFGVLIVDGDASPPDGIGIGAIGAVVGVTGIGVSSPPLPDPFTHSFEYSLKKSHAPFDISFPQSRRLNAGNAPEPLHPIWTNLPKRTSKQNGCKCVKRAK